MAESVALPVLFVVDHDRNSLVVSISDLSRRFGNDFTVLGETSAHTALDALQRMKAADEAVALLLVDDATAFEFLPSAHELHPSAKRVLLVDRDYRSTSPAVQAMTVGQADYHLVRPWADDEMMYGSMSEYLASWTREQEPTFELFRIVAEEGDSRVLQLRDGMTRFSMPFGFYSVESDEAAVCSTKPGSTPNIAVRHRTEVVDGAGDGRLERITLADRAKATEEEVAAAALFIMIGGEPHTRWLPDDIARDPQGYVVMGRDVLDQPGVHWELDREPLLLETSLSGVFAAGAVRQGFDQTCRLSRRRRRDGRASRSRTSARRPS